MGRFELRLSRRRTWWHFGEPKRPTLTNHIPLHTNYIVREKASFIRCLVIMRHRRRKGGSHIEIIYMQCKFTLGQFAVYSSCVLRFTRFFTKETLRGEEDPTPPTGEQPSGYVSDPSAGPTGEDVHLSTPDRVQETQQQKNVNLMWNLSGWWGKRLGLLMVCSYRFIIDIPIYKKIYI